MHYFIFFCSFTILFEFVSHFHLFIFRFLAFLIVDEILDFVLCTAFGKRQDTRPSIIFELGSTDSLFSSD